MNWIAYLAIQLRLVTLPSPLLSSFNAGGGEDADDEFVTDIPRSEQPMPRAPSTQIKNPKLLKITVYMN